MYEGLRPRGGGEVQVGGEEPEQAGGGERLHLRRQEGERMIVLSACPLVLLSARPFVLLPACLLVQTSCKGVLQPREVGCRICGERGRGGGVPRPTQALL